MMRFMVDECLFRQIVERLRDRGHDVVWAKQECPGLDDEALWARATAEQRLIVSEDRDFGELTVKDRKPAIGVVIVAAGEFDSSLDKIAERVAQTIDEVGAGCIGHLTTIEPGRVRSRKLR